LRARLPGCSGDDVHQLRDGGEVVIAYRVCHFPAVCLGLDEARGPQVLHLPGQGLGGNLDGRGELPVGGRLPLQEGSEDLPRRPAPHGRYDLDLFPAVSTRLDVPLVPPVPVRYKEACIGEECQVVLGHAHGKPQTFTDSPEMYPGVTRDKVEDGEAVRGVEEGRGT